MIMNDLANRKFTIYEWEYVSVIENTCNLQRLKEAWERKIDKAKASILLERLVASEGIHILICWNDNRSAFVIRNEHGTLKMHLGKDLSAGLIYHEYAHVILMERESQDNHGPLFTRTLDMLLHKYEEDWR